MDLDSDDAELDPSFFRRPMATKRALSSDQDDAEPRKKAKIQEPSNDKSKQRSLPTVERKHPSSTKKTVLKGSLARNEVRSNGSEAARTVSTLKSSASSEKLFFSDSTDQEPGELVRSLGSGPNELLENYQEDYSFGFDAHIFEVPSPDPAPEVETATAHSEVQSISKTSAQSDTKDDDGGVHDWYKAVAGDEEAFDRLFSSIEFVDEPFE
jgi:hypothetical protein